MKTNAMRMLDSAKIKYDVMEYSIDKDKFSGVAVSDLLNMEYSQCYKTLGLISGHGIYIAVIPVNKELDLKKAARAMNVKSVDMIHVRDLLKLVGYERGSVSPVGVKKNNGIYFDSEVNNHEVIEISGGMYGTGIKVKRDELLKYLGAKVDEICIQ